MEAFFVILISESNELFELLKIILPLKAVDYNFQRALQNRVSSCPDQHDKGRFAIPSFIKMRSLPFLLLLSKHCFNYFLHSISEFNLIVAQ